MIAKGRFVLLPLLAALLALVAVLIAACGDGDGDGNGDGGDEFEIPIPTVVAPGINRVFDVKGFPYTVVLPEGWVGQVNSRTTVSFGPEPGKTLLDIQVVSLSSRSKEIEEGGLPALKVDLEERNRGLAEQPGEGVEAIVEGPEEITFNGVSGLRNSVTLASGADQGIRFYGYTFIDDTNLYTLICTHTIGTSASLVKEPCDQIAESFKLRGLPGLTPTPSVGRSSPLARDGRSWPLVDRGQR